MPPAGPSRVVAAPPAHVDSAREAAPHVAASSPVAPAPPSLARETELVDVALTAMSSGRPADALAAIERYDAETAGRGQLAEDAAAIAVEALCRLGDGRATEMLADFTARWPRSRERARLEARCRRTP